MAYPSLSYGYYLAITLSVIIIVIMVASDLTIALLIVGLIANFFIISSQLALIEERRNDEHSESGIQHPPNVLIAAATEAAAAAEPAAAPTCQDNLSKVCDALEPADEIAIGDGDELNAYHVRARNNPERALFTRRKKHMDAYVRDELDHEENTRWWGVGEY